jgi:hypothetical protein
MALRATKGDEDAVAAGRRFRCFFAGSSTERSASGAQRSPSPETFPAGTVRCWCRHARQERLHY